MPKITLSTTYRIKIALLCIYVSKRKLLYAEGIDTYTEAPQRTYRYLGVEPVYRGIFRLSLELQERTKWRESLKETENGNNVI